MRAALALALVGLTGCGGAATGGGAPVAVDGGVDAGDVGPVDAGVLARLWYVAPSDGSNDISDGIGDGSRDHPFGDAAAAYAVARAGDVIVLLPGEHAAPGVPPADVVLTGSGAESTRVNGPWLIDGPAVVRELTVVGGDPALRVAAAVDFEAVAVSGRLLVEGALVARDLMLQGTLEVSAGATLTARGGAWTGEGSALRSAGTVTLDGIWLSAPAGEAVVIDGGEATLTAITIADAAIGVQVLGGRVSVREGRFEAITDPGAVGAAVRVSGGEVMLDAITIDDSDRGLRVDEGGVLTATGVLVRAPRTDGLSVQGGAASVEGLRVEAPRNVGVAVLAGGRVTLADATVVAPGRIGVLVDGATLDSSGVLVEGAVERGVALSRAVATLDGLAVRAAGNVGVQITDPAGLVRLVDAVISDCGTTGIAVFGDGGPVEFAGVVVEGTRVGEGDLGEGVHIFQASAQLMGVIARDNARAGVLFEQATGAIRDGQLVGNGDPGLVVIEAREPVVASGLVVEGNGGAGLLVLGGELSAIGVRAVGNRSAIGLGPGHGMQAAVGGTLTIEGGAAEDNAASGVAFEIASGGRVSGMTLRGNRDYGLLMACGTAVEEGAANVFVDNGRGERGGCP